MKLQMAFVTFSDAPISVTAVLHIENGSIVVINGAGNADRNVPQSKTTKRAELRSSNLSFHVLRVMVCREDK